MASHPIPSLDDPATTLESPQAPIALPADISLTPMIVAGIPNPADPSQADSPDRRIDPNLPTSPFAGVGSLEIVAPGIGSFLCSGTAISPRHILTAAHCLDVDEEDGIIDVQPQNVTFNVNAQGELAAPIGITAAELHIFDTGSDRYEGFSNSVNNDLALITLSEPLPVGIPIYKLATEPLENLTTITLVGYGTSGNGIDGHDADTVDERVKRTGQNQVDDASLFAFLIPEIDEVFMYDFDGPDVSTNSLAGLGSGLTLGNQIETTVGPGDSGGPSFVQVGDEWILVGVNTFGFAFPNLEAPETEVIQGTFGTGGGGVIVSDPEKLAWIKSIVGDELGEDNFNLASLAGVVWNDLDGNGDRTAAEALLADWTVYLDLNQNGILDEDEPTTLTDTTGAYTFTDLAPGTYTVATLVPPGWQQTTPQPGTFEPFNADFSNGAEADLDGFTINNLTTGDVPGLWHLTTARANQPGHSPEHSLYFGQNETATGGGNYDVGHTAGQVISPEIDLTTLESATLTFNYFLNVEPNEIGDLPEVRVSAAGQPFQTIAAKDGGLLLSPSQAASWSSATLSLDEFVGNQIRIQFSFDTLDEFVNNLEGWFIDDVVVTGVSSDRYTVTLDAGENLTGLDFGQQPTTLEPPSEPEPMTPAASPFVGLFDYEQWLRYRGASNANMPTEAIDNLPLVQFFDETYYLRNHADVAAAVSAGTHDSGYQHFVTYGLFEGRNPSQLYSEAFYLANNADVARDVDAGIHRSGLEHFLKYGHEENRNPSEQFNQNDYLAQNTDVAAAVNDGTLQSAFEHYIKYGADEEGRLPSTPTPGPQAIFNEAFYLRNNPDVAAGVNQGRHLDGFDHFIQYGQLENRAPNAAISLSGYLSANGDVQSAVSEGLYTSGFDHLEQFGRFENRPLA